MPAPVPVVRFETALGEQMQVDWASLRRGPDRLSVFVATLGWSRAAYVEFVTDERLVTLLAAWTLSLTPWRAGTAVVFMMAFSVVAALVCAGSLISALAADDLTGRFLDYRWIPPLDYPNTTAAFCFMAAIPPLVVAARPGRAGLGGHRERGADEVLHHAVVQRPRDAASLGGARVERALEQRLALDPGPVERPQHLTLAAVTDDRERFVTVPDGAADEVGERLGLGSLAAQR